MDDPRIAVVGIGATGAVLAAALLARNPEALLVARRTGLKDQLKKNGITVTGELNYRVPVHNVVERITELKGYDPNLIFIATKTFHLHAVIDALKEIFQPGMKIVSTHNGLGTEDVIADVFGADAVFRMTLNYGVSLHGPCEVSAAFFNRPNHLGALVPENQPMG